MHFSGWRSACVCKWTQEFVSVCTGFLMLLSGYLDVLHQQREEPNGKGKQPIITPSRHWVILQKFSVEIHSVVCNQAWPKGCNTHFKHNSRRQYHRGWKKRAWKGSRIARHSLWATVRVFVFLIWVWFVVEAESEGKYWILPLHLSTCLINPMSHCHSPSP